MHTFEAPLMANKTPPMDETLADAFNEYSGDSKSTPTATGFVLWLRKNKPALTAQTKPTVLTAFAEQYVKSAHSGSSSRYM